MTTRGPGPGKAVLARLLRGPGPSSAPAPGPGPGKFRQGADCASPALGARDSQCGPREGGAAPVARRTQDEMSLRQEFSGKEGPGQAGPSRGQEEEGELDGLREKTRPWLLLLSG